MNAKPKKRTVPEMAWSVDEKRISLSLAGESYPEDTFAVYEPIFLWLEDVLKTVPHSIPFWLHLSLVYTNTSTMKVLLTLVEKLHKHYLESERKIFLVYRVHEDDEDVAEMAEELFAELPKELTTIERYK